MIILQAYMNVKPEKRQSFLDGIQTLLKSSRKETGNTQYQLFENTENPNHFVMLEQWEDEKALLAHQQTEHFQSFIGSSTEALAEPLQIIRTEKGVNTYE
ncbi:putative quinol monooxygenase [Bacillus changyiensis]|uniref:putative quinol monooxygenase n=1 Tax=Bacillus changyiensis TaxID=3004103 RepID=UPI0022E7B522|nr:putative quinol monooxygenase [Bacillus changyiensis]MDA1477850.1 putative quinol monooxygenase [Bacillus changyiensis]